MPPERAFVNLACQGCAESCRVLCLPAMIVQALVPLALAAIAMSIPPRRTRRGSVAGSVVAGVFIGMIVGGLLSYATRSGIFQLASFNDWFGDGMKIDQIRNTVVSFAVVGSLIGGAIGAAIGAAANQRSGGPRNRNWGPPPGHYPPQYPHQPPRYPQQGQYPQQPPPQQYAPPQQSAPPPAYPAAPPPSAPPVYNQPAPAAPTAPPPIAVFCSACGSRLDPASGRCQSCTPG